MFPPLAPFFQDRRDFARRSYGGQSPPPPTGDRQSSNSRRRRFVSLRCRFARSRRSRALADGCVGTRRRGTRRASRSAPTSRSTASSRFRHWLRSSCATARTTGPARLITRCFWMSVRAVDAATSKIASTLVSVRWACWPPGPLDRENRSSISDRGMATERVTRIDSRSTCRPFCSTSTAAFT